MVDSKIVIGKSDHDKLTQLANALLDSKPEIADALLGELERARVVLDDNKPSSTVQMGSSVTFKTEDGQKRRVTLVYPAEADIAQEKISVLTPIGTALLGLSARQSIDFSANDGRKRTLTVVAVQ